MKYSISPGSLVPNLDYYEPRTSHGSSLSPAIHAGLLARVGRFEESLRLFRMACFLDLENLNETTALGLHLATFGGVWQALVFGYLGMRPGRDGLTVDPMVPPSWGRLSLTLRFHGHRVHVSAEPDAVTVSAGGPVTVVLPGAGATEVGAHPSRWIRTGEGWQPSS